MPVPSDFIGFKRGNEGKVLSEAPGSAGSRDGHLPWAPASLLCPCGFFICSALIDQLFSYPNAVWSDVGFLFCFCFFAMETIQNLIFPGGLSPVFSFQLIFNGENANIEKGSVVLWKRQWTGI